MRLIKPILIVVAVIVALPLVIALFVSGDFNYEKSITINAPVETVWTYTSSLEGLDKWNPWDEKDPNMKKTREGTDGQVGASQSWESDKDEVGAGKQTIAKIEAPNYFETDIKFLTPYESEAKGYVSLKKVEEGTEATWGFKSEMPYPFRIMKLFFDAEKQMGPEFEKGLNNLKSLAES